MDSMLCPHQENIRGVENHIEEGVCKFCGQVSHYIWENNGRRVKILIKLGQINGQYVWPGHKTKHYIFELADNEIEVLKSLNPPIKPMPEPEPIIIEEVKAAVTTEPKTKKEDVRKKIRRCKDCEHRYEHDGIFWCNTKKCPSHYPKHLRPQYRPSRHRADTTIEHNADATQQLKTSESFGEWAVLELMGHRRMAGYLTETTKFGGAFLRIDIHGKDGRRTTQYYSPSAVYCITPTTERYARIIAEQSEPAPVNRWEFPQLQAIQRCRVCGCTEDKACMTEAGPCYWIEPDLCSACAEAENLEV